MLTELKEKFINSTEVYFAEKYIIVSDYYSKNGDLLDSILNAHTQNIKVLYDIVMISKTDKTETSMLLPEMGTTVFSKIIQTRHGNKISSIIENIVTSKLTTIILTVTGPTDSIKLTDGLLLKLFSLFNNVHIVQSEDRHNEIVLPDGDFKLSSFSLSGGTVIIPNNFTMTTKADIKVSSSIIECATSDIPVLQLIGKHTVLDQLSFYQPVKITVGPPYQPDSDSFAETEVDLTKLYFYLLGYDTVNEKSSNKIFEDPLITVESNNYTEVLDTELIGGSYRKFIKFSGVKSVVINNLSRSSESINAYSIGLDSIRSFKMVDCNILGKQKSKTNAKAVLFDMTSTTILDTAEINGINLQNCDLSDISGLNIKSFSIQHCNCDGLNFILSKNSNVNTLSISSSRIEVSDSIFIEGNSIDFTNCKLISENRDVTIYGKNNVKIYDSKITCDNKNMLFKLENEAKLTIKNSDILAKDFTVRKNEKDDSQLIQALEKVSLKSINISNTNFKLGGTFSINGIDNHSYDGIRFTNANSIEISNAITFFASSFALDIDKIIPIIFKSVVFKNAYIVSDNSPSKVPFTFKECSGKLSFMILDTNTSNRTSCDVNVTSDNSKIDLIVGSKIFNVRTKIKSSKSLGSNFYGGNNVVVIPEIISDDVELFERVDSPNTKKYDKVCYGNV